MEVAFWDMGRWFTFDFASCQKSSDLDDKPCHNYSHSASKQRFGVRVDWDEYRHYETIQLEPYRLIGDVEMDRILELCFTGDDRLDRFYNVVESCEKIYLQTSNSKSPKTLSDCERAMYEFYLHYSELIPEWVDWEQIQKGIDVFVTFSPVASQALFYLSLVPGFAIPKIASVLSKTRYLSPPSNQKQVQARLFDTGGFLLSCMTNDKSNDSISAFTLRPGGSAWKMALEVRVLHAKVRRSILKSRKDWDLNSYGIPINQEDMAATLLAFSVNVLNGIEFVAGRPLDYESQLNYLALWRYIGWLLGVETNEDSSLFHRHSFQFSTKSHLEAIDPCGPRSRPNGMDNSLIHSRATLESIILHLMEPDVTSIKIAHHLLSLGNNSSSSFGCYYRHLMCRRYIGNDLADALQLHSSTSSLQHLLAFILTYMILFMLRLYTNVILSSQFFRHRAQYHHDRLHMKFLNHWKYKHVERMDDAARVIYQEKNTTISTCPFAMIMPVLEYGDND